MTERVPTVVLTTMYRAFGYSLDRGLDYLAADMLITEESYGIHSAFSSNGGTQNMPGQHAPHQGKLLTDCVHTVIIHQLTVSQLPAYLMVNFTFKNGQLFSEILLPA